LSPLYVFLCTEFSMLFWFKVNNPSVCSDSNTGKRHRTTRKWPFLLVLLTLGLITVSTPVSAQTIVEKRVATGNDDAEQHSGDGQMNLSSSDLELVVDGSYDINAVRFTGVAVPQGATISNAYIQFQCDEVSTGVSSLTIRGQDIDDAPGFTSTAFDISSRTVTTASVAWSPPDWNTVDEAGTNQRTADISSIIQEIVNRPGWISGNDIVIIFTGTGTRTAESYDGSSAAAPLLHVEHDGEPVTSTYYVRPDGNNANSGTGPSASEALQTIDYAVSIRVTSPGDLVYVKPGAYIENVKGNASGSAAAPIKVIADTQGSISGWSAGEVTIQATANKPAIDVNNRSYIHFQGFTIQGDSSQPTISVNKSVGFEISKCEIYGGADGIRVADSTSNVTIKNCLIRNNGSKGIQIFNGIVTVWNSTIVDNVSDGVELDAGTLTITNSIIANNGDAGLDHNAGTFTHTYNLVYGNSGTNFEGTSASTGEISADPQFLSATDYHLQGNSPAVDSGTDSGAVPGDDLEGRIRPQQSGYDMGCYEGNYLVGHWRLDETTGTTAVDSSIYGHDGTVSGSTNWSSDSAGNGVFDFDGSTNYITVTNTTDLQITNSITLAGWIKGAAWGSGIDVDILIRKGEENPNNYQLAIADGLVQLSLDQNDGEGYRGNTLLETNRWYHVVGTWDGATVKIYVNGVLDNTPAAKTGTLGVDTRPIYLGGRSGTDLTDGMLRDLRIYQRALSETEVAELYGLVGHWKMDEGIGASAADSTAFGNHLTISGASWASDCSGNNALKFDGVGDTAVTGSNFDPPATGAVAFWMRSAGNPADRSRPFGLGDDWEMRQETDGTLSLDIGDEGPPEFVTTEGLSDENRWYHVVAQFDEADDSFSVYVDGELMTSGTNSSDMVKQSENLLTFGTRTGSTQYWKGAMRDFRIYNRWLLSEEIVTLSKTAGHWEFDETSGMVAADSTVNANDGTYNGPTLGVNSVYAPENGTAVAFDGLDDYVEIPHTDSMLADEGTVAFWFRTTQYTATQGLLSKDSSYFDTGGHLTIRLLNGKVNARLQSTSESYEIESSALAVVKWTHVAFVWGSNGMFLYVNGREEATNPSYTGGLGTSSGGTGNFEPIVLGANSWASGDLSATPLQDYFSGAMDDIRFYTRSLCGEEVFKIYRGGRAPGVRIIKWLETR
jgi:hypothetical protein